MRVEDIRKQKMQALKDQDKFANQILTRVLSELTYISKEIGQEPGEKEVLQAIKKLIKQNEETLRLSEDRADIANNLQAEIAFLKQYLPETMPFDVLLEQVKKIGESEAIPQTPQSKGLMMKTCMAAFSGKADNKDIAKAVDCYLNAEA